MAIGVMKCPLAGFQDGTILKLFERPSVEGKETHTGVDVSVPDNVHSVCAGVVTACSMGYDGHYAVTVEYDASKCFRYLHLKSTELQLGQRVKGNDVIGVPDKYVHFELCQISSNVGKLNFPVRVGSRVYEKVDPIEYVLSSSSLYQGDDE